MRGANPAEAAAGGAIYNHRAINALESSISTMRWVRSNMLVQPAAAQLKADCGRMRAATERAHAAEAKAKEFERKNFQTVSEMKLQSNKDVNDALSSARASFAKEKEELLRKVEEERLQSRLEVQREKEAIRQKSDEIIDEIALEFRREIETRSFR